MADPEVIGPYRIVGRISKGGMAQVYLAEDPAHGRRVALKVLLPQIAEDVEFRLRFRHEVQAHMALKHPNIVELYDHQAEGESLYMAMELVDGVTLKKLLRDATRLPPQAAVHIATEALRGLEAAHLAGVVHRDVKPSNIMIGRDGRVKMADFGIATAETFTRLTLTGNIVGTPAYMSPEQARGEHADKRTDLFAMGVILYECLVGRNPFQSDHPATTLRRVIDTAQTPIFEINPAISPELEAVVDNLMEKNVIRRYGDATEVLRDLETVRSARLGGDFDEAALAQLMADPRGEASRIERAAADGHYRRGIELYKEGQGRPELAIWELYQAVSIDPAHEEARNSLEIISEQRGYRLQASDDADILRLRERLEQEPANANLLVQLAKLYKKEGNFLQVIRCYVKLRKLHNRDRYLETQMNTLVGVDYLEAFDRTRSLVARRQEPPTKGAAPTPDLAAAGGAPGAIAGPRLRLPPRPHEREGGGEGFLKSLFTPPVIISMGVVIILGLVVRAMLSGSSKPEPLVRPGELALDINDALAGGEPQASRSEADALLDRAGQFLAQKRAARAEEMYQRFIDKFPDDPRRGVALLGYVRALEARGEREQALKASYEGLPRVERAADVREIRRFRARILAALGRVDEAVTEYRAVQALNDPAASPRALMDIALLLRGAERGEEALDEVDGLLGFYPRWAGATEARLLKAELLVGMGRGDEALPVLRAVQDATSIDAPEYKRAAKLKKRIEDGDDAGGAAGAGTPRGEG